MTNRHAIRQHPVLTALVLLVGAWLILTALNVFTSMGSTGPFEGYVGHTPTSGWIGLGVILAALGFLVVINSELGQSGPLPQSFPPGESREREHGGGRERHHTRRADRMASARTDRAEPRTYYECQRCGTVSESDEAIEEPHTRYCGVCEAETEWVPANGGERPE